MNEKITLKSARVNAGLTLIQASELLKISSNTLSSWENGKTFPTVDYLPKIQEAYKINYESIKFLP